MRTSSFIISENDTAITLSYKVANGAVFPVEFKNIELDHWPTEIIVQIHGENDICKRDICAEK